MVFEAVPTTLHGDCPLLVEHGKSVWNFESEEFPHSLRTYVGMDELHYAYYEQAREDAEEELRAVDDLIAFYEELCALRLL